jgi:hypothetical protein
METEYQTLIELYNIPDEFVSERHQIGVTHSLGRRLGEDGLESGFTSTHIGC